MKKFYTILLSLLLLAPALAAQKRNGANEQKLSTVINDSTIFLIISVNLKIEFEIKSSEQI